MNSFFLLFFIFYLLFFLLDYFNKKTIENYLPFPVYSSPPRRNMPYDLRCMPYIPKRHFPWNNSPYGYYYRPKCLVMG